MKFTQKEMILRHLENVGSITSKEAIDRYGITRLASVVCKLKGDGYQISSKLVAKKNRLGETCYVSEYRLR